MKILKKCLSISPLLDRGGHLALICRRLYFRLMPGMLRHYAFVCCSDFEYFTFFRDISKKKFLWGGSRNIPPPHQMWGRSKIKSRFSNFFSWIFDRKDFILWTFFWKKYEFSQIFLIHYISDHSLIFGKF